MIVDLVEEVEERAEDTAAVSEEQSTTSEEIARSMQSMSTAARESAAGVPQVSGSAEGASSLTSRPSRFRSKKQPPGPTSQERASNPEGDGAPRDALPTLFYVRRMI